MSAMNALEGTLYASIGAATGAAYFALLLWTVRLHVAGAAAVLVVPLYAVRLVVAVAVFWGVAQQGAFALLFALLGFIAARGLARRWRGRA